MVARVDNTSNLLFRQYLVLWIGQIAPITMRKCEKNWRLLCNNKWAIVEKTAVLCAVVLIVFVRKIFEFEFFVKYCAWAAICNGFDILVKYQNNTILC